MKRYGELQIGITVLAAVIVLVAGVLWFKGYSAGRETIVLQVYFQQASGLGKGDPVEVAGVAQGTVDRISYEKGRALVTLSVRKTAEIYADARVRIMNSGLMGQKLVAIDPGRPALGLLNYSRPLEGTMDAGVEDMMLNVGRAISTLETLAARFNGFLAALDSAGGGVAAARTLRNVEHISGDLAGLTSGSRKSLEGAINDFETAAGELRAILSEKGPRMRGSIDSFAAASGRLDSLTVEMSALSRELREVVARSRSRDSSVGALLDDRQLYDRLLATVSRTDSLLADIQRHPKKYFKFSVF